MSKRRDTSTPRLLLFALTAVLVLSLFVPLTTSTAGFSAFNAEWDGASGLRSLASETGVETEAAPNTATYASSTPTETVAFVLSPDSRYASEDAARIREFVQRGGTLVVADDYGRHANDLLRVLNVSARLDGRPLRDARSNYRSEAMPVAEAVTNHPAVAGVDSVTLNYGTAVEPRGATTLVNTSRYAYLDTNQNATLDNHETMRTYPVATVESVGAGQVVVVGDSSVFINAMLDREGNEQFTRALLSGKSRLLLDYSHTDALPLLALAALVVRQSTALRLGLGVIAVGAVAVWSRRPRLGFDFAAAVPRFGRTDALETESLDVEASSAELTAYLARQHPDWDRERVERIASALERRRNR